jgi:hypothetical protein
MVGELLCPDCGGVVGATETTEAGPPCKCFVADPADKDRHETISDAAPPVEPAVTKICRLCGADVAGKKRVRDHLGYYCYECAKAQEEKDRGGRVPCRVCGKLTKKEALTDYEGTMMCPRCHQERIDAVKQQIKRIGFKGARTREEIRRMNQLLVVLGILLVIMLYGAWHMFHH